MQPEEKYEDPKKPPEYAQDGMGGPEDWVPILSVLMESLFMLVMSD